MKTAIKNFLLTCLLLSTATLYANTEEVLTNKKIMELCKRGISPAIILSKIKTSKNNFDVSTDALIDLSEHKIPDNIVNAMVEASDNSSTATEVNENDPLSRHESGIYFELKTSHHELKEMEPTVCSQSSTNKAAQRLISGLINSKKKAKLAGNEARIQIDSSTCNSLVFYFYFDPAKSSLNSNTIEWGFQNATSPNEFILVKTEVKGNSREFVTGTESMIGSSSGVSDKGVVLFDFDKLASGIYKVTPRIKLPAGEYCWMYAGNVPKDQGQKVYDFGIKY